jgi:hypothetical protein
MKYAPKNIQQSREKLSVSNDAHWTDVKLGYVLKRIDIVEMRKLRWDEWIEFGDDEK